MQRLAVQPEIIDDMRSLGLDTEEIAGSRSALLQIIGDSAGVAAVAITLAQGPLTIAQWIQVLRRWRSRKPPTDVVTLAITAPGIKATIEVNTELEFEQAATAIVRLAASQQQPPADDTDGYGI